MIVKVFKPFKTLKDQKLLKHGGTFFFFRKSLERVAEEVENKLMRLKDHVIHTLTAAIMLAGDNT